MILDNLKVDKWLQITTFVMTLDEVVRPHVTKYHMPIKADLPEVPLQDRPLIENILYSLYILQESGQTPISWNVSIKEWGYLVSVSFAENFSLSLVDLQIAKDLSPLRVENVFIRNGVSTDVNGAKVGCTVVVKVLNGQQRVSITEAEIVRFRKRKRGWFAGN